MKTTVVIEISLLILLSTLIYGQSGNINNTLGTGGTFSIKDGSTTFVTLSQSDGYLDVNNSLTLPATTDTSLGVIFKGNNRFIHDYMASLTDGKNTFVGLNAGNFSMSRSAMSYDASYNTAVGYSVLDSLTSGYSNSAFGSQSMQSTSTGYQNTAFGMSSLASNTTGCQNTAVGYGAGNSNTIGTANTALGYNAGNNIINGSYNTALGYNAGNNITVGNNVTCIGYNATASSEGASSEITLGDGNIATLRCNTSTITSLSDARDKRNIRDLPLGLEFLMNVRPRLFNWDRRDWYTNGKPDGLKMQTTPTAGFIAQELDAAQKNEHAEWLNLVLKSNPNRLEATPGNLLPIMVKAIQELKMENDELKSDIQTLRTAIAQMQEAVKAVRNSGTKDKVSMTETKN